MLLRWRPERATQEAKKGGGGQRKGDQERRDADAEGHEHQRLGVTDEAANHPFLVAIVMRQARWSSDLSRCLP